MRQQALTKRRGFRIEEQGGPREPEVITGLTSNQRLLPGSVTKAAFEQLTYDTPRRVPFSNAQMSIVPSRSPGRPISNTFVLGRPGTGEGAMDGHRLSIANLTKHTHFLEARDGVNFGGVGGPPVVSLASNTPFAPGGIFVDGDEAGSRITLRPFASLEIMASRGRWQVMAGRHIELSKE